MGRPLTERFDFAAAGYLRNTKIHAKCNCMLVLRFLGTFFALLLFSYTTLTALVFQSLNCVPVAGRQVVYSQPSVDCNSSIYHTWLGWIYLLLVFPVVGFPLVLTIFLVYIKLKKVRQCE